jgi:hypothetical protein
LNGYVLKGSRLKSIGPGGTELGTGLKKEIPWQKYFYFIRNLFQSRYRSNQRAGKLSGIPSFLLSSHTDKYAARFDIFTDDDGYSYISGTTRDNNFPATQGAYQTERKGEADAFVAKFSPD